MYILSEHALPCLNAASSLIPQHLSYQQRAALHSTPLYSSLGVVELLREETSIALPAGSSRRFWEVVEFRPDASALETWKTPEVLGLHPRDVHLFTSDSGTGQPRAMILPRSNAILFRTEIARAVIYADKAVLFPARRLQDTVRVAQAIKSALAQKSALPFELKVLESLLSETATMFDKKSKRLGMVAETVLDDISRSFHGSAGELQRSLPIARKLTEVQHDVKETLDAIAEVANYDDQLQALCLTDRTKALNAALKSPKGGGGGGHSHAAGAVLGGHDPRNDHDHSHATSGHRSMSTIATGASASTSSSTNASTADSYFEQEMLSSPLSTTGTAKGGTTAAGGGVSGDYNRGFQNGTTAAGGVATGGSSSRSGAGSLPSTQAAAAAAVIAARSPHMRMASRILETYEFRIMGTHSALNEMIENMEQTRTVWHMQLDHQRNRVLRVNLLISVASLGGIICTLPAAFFGMNLDSGLEDLPGVFWPVVQGSVTTGLVCASLIYTYWKIGPKRKYTARLQDMRSLRDLLSYHMDDLDAIIEAVRAKGSLTKKEFTDVVSGAVRGKPMSKEEVALLFRVFDANRDAVLELSELMKLEELHDSLGDHDHMGHHLDRS